ncbi:MAG TPA: response regulator [Nevskiales bacterium]|nr:response regulator [Nevskiales bacterium]
MNQAQAPARARVLFVDDEPRILNTMRMLFRGRYEVLTADGGAQALELLKTRPVDVIVSDQRMPGMTGIELLRQARERMPGAMRILLTGYSDLNAIIGSINEGEIFRFVNKPWFDEDLIATVARAVDAARATQAAAASEDAHAAAATAANGVPAAVLVLDDNPSVPHKIQEILGGQCRVLGSSTLQEAVSLLERERIGVVVSDTRVQDNPVTGLISALKQQRPEVVCVILTERADADSAINLINQGQIYRFITKPIHDGQCRIMVNSALRQHQRLVQNPVLHRRYEVVAAPAPEPASSSAALIERVRTLRTWAKRWV